MKLSVSDNRRCVAIAAYRSHHFLGYAVKTLDGSWIAVASIGMSWSKWKCNTTTDATTWLRTTTHAGKFEWFSEVTDLIKVTQKLPEYAKPGITIESLGDTVSLPTKLNP